MAEWYCWAQVETIWVQLMLWLHNPPQINARGPLGVHWPNKCRTPQPLRRRFQSGFFLILGPPEGGVGWVGSLDLPPSLGGLKKRSLVSISVLPVHLFWGYLKNVSLNWFLFDRCFLFIFLTEVTINDILNIFYNNILWRGTTRCDFFIEFNALHCSRCFLYWFQSIASHHFIYPYRTPIIVVWVFIDISSLHNKSNWLSKWKDALNIRISG